jgi:hypothetical protein
MREYGSLLVVVCAKPWMADQCNGEQYGTSNINCQKYLALLKTKNNKNGTGQYYQCKVYVACHAGTSPNWHLDHVEVTDSITGHTYIFPCGQWIGKDRGEGILESILCPLPTFSEPSRSCSQLPAPAIGKSSSPTIHTMRSVSVTAAGSMPSLAGRGSSSASARAAASRGPSCTQDVLLRQDMAVSQGRDVLGGVGADKLQDRDPALEACPAEGRDEAEYHMLLHADG